MPAATQWGAAGTSRDGAGHFAANGLDTCGWITASMLLVACSSGGADAARDASTAMTAPERDASASDERSRAGV